MLPGLPAFIPIIFIFTTLLTGVLLYVSLKQASGPTAHRAAIVISGWLTGQALLGIAHVYSAHPEAMPPRIMLLGIAPALLVVIVVFATKKGRAYTDTLSLKKITWIHTIRIPVELVLYWLSLQKVVPLLMTFEGRNFDILAGITAPVMALFFCTGSKTNNWILLAWNIVSLLLLLNIVGNALLSAPGPLQRLAFDQPNIALLYFPFNWLPVFIVPVVLFGHLVAIRRLLR